MIDTSIYLSQETQSLLAAFSAEFAISEDELKRVFLQHEMREREVQEAKKAAVEKERRAASLNVHQFKRRSSDK